MYEIITADAGEERSTLSSRSAFPGALCAVTQHGLGAAGKPKLWFVLECHVNMS